MTNRTASVWRSDHLSAYLVGLDVLSFAIQASGIIMATLPRSSVEMVSRGIHVYMAGIGTQQAFVLLSAFVLFKLYQALRIAEREKVAQHRVWLLYVVLALISVRIAFRLVEYSGGIESDISRQEAYIYCFDSLPMLLATLLFNIFHPGRNVGHKDDGSDPV